MAAVTWLGVWSCTILASSVLGRAVSTTIEEFLSRCVCELLSRSVCRLRYFDNSGRLFYLIQRGRHNDRYWRRQINSWMWVGKLGNGDMGWWNAIKITSFTRRVHAGNMIVCDDNVRFSV
jgi:hypothetical protein